jgi:hypothetical protein
MLLTPSMSRAARRGRSRLQRRHRRRYDGPRVDRGGARRKLQNKFVLRSCSADGGADHIRRAPRPESGARGAGSERCGAGAGDLRAGQKKRAAGRATGRWVGPNGCGLRNCRTISWLLKPPGLGNAVARFAAFSSVPAAAASPRSPTGSGPDSVVSKIERRTRDSVSPNL